MNRKTIIHIPLLALVLLGLSTELAAEAVPVPLRFRTSRAPAGATVDANREIEKIVIKDKTELPTAALAQAIGEAFSLGFWMRVESEMLLTQSGGWTDTVPLTVLVISSADNKERLVIRLPQGRVSVASTTGKDWPVMNSSARVEANQWYHVVLTRSGVLTKLYINGALDATSELLPRLTNISNVMLGRFGSMRHFDGTLIEPRAYAGALGDTEIKSLADARPKEIGGASVGATQVGAVITFGRYPVMRVADGELHPLIDQLHLSATVVHWRGNQAKDLFICGLHPNYFGGRPAYFQQKGVDHRGLPFYDEGTTIKGLPGTEFFSVVHGNGREELFAKGVDTPHGDNNLISYTRDAAPGALEFGTARIVTIDGRSFEQAFGKQIGGWWVGGMDDDGIPDILVSIIKPDGANYWPDGEGMWAGIERKNSGKGRGYDVQGEWLGNRRTSILYWAKGQIDSKGQLAFVNKKTVHYGQIGFDVQWKAGERERALACVKLEGRPVILHTGSVDRILALPVRLRNGELIVEEARPLLEGGASLYETYFAHSISVLEEKADGTLRLLLDGNPGRLVVLEGKAIGKFREVGSLLMQGGPLAVDTLGTPVRYDWDGDGFADMIIGDSSGWLTFWRGTKDVSVYHAGIFMTAGGKVIHHQAGVTGSIQGPNEKRWGYLQPTVGDWDGDGKAEIITNDISGVLTLYGSTSKPSDLAAPLVFKKDGKIYHVAWRSRPAIIPAGMNFAGSRMPTLLHMDWDGDLAVAIPDVQGSLNIVRVEKPAYEDGKPIVLCGPCGSWGRAELSVVDWNGDGKWDIVFGTIRGNQRFYSKDRGPGASPYWLENVGTNEKPVFAAARPIKLKDGRHIDFGIHTAAAYPTDLDNDGAPDLIVGAEDGKIYRFFRSDLE